MTMAVWKIGRTITIEAVLSSLFWWWWVWWWLRLTIMMMVFLSSAF